MPNVVGGSVVWNLDIDKSKFSSGLKSARSDIEAAAKGIKGNFADATSSVSKFGSNAALSLKNVGDSMAGVGQSIISAAKKGALAIAGLTAAAGIFSFQSASDFQQARIAFDTMLGSVSEGQIMMQKLSDFARVTPFTLPEVVTGAKQLLAYGITAKQILPDLKILGDISAGVGRDKLPFLTLALGQVYTKGHLAGQEIRQFTEAGVPLVEQLAKSFGKTKDQIVSMSEDGLISFDMVQKSLGDMTTKGGRFFDLMDKQSKTFGGVMSNLQDNLGRVARNIIGLSDTGDVIKGSLFDKVSIAAQELLQWVDANKDAIIAFAQGALATAITWGKQFFDTLVLVVAFLKAHEKEVKTFAIIIGVFAATAIVAAGLMAIAVNWVAIVVGIAIAQIVALVMSLIDTWYRLKDAAIALWGQITIAFNTAVAQVSAVLQRIPVIAVAMWEAVKTAFFNGVNAVVTFFQLLPQRILFGIGYIAGALTRFAFIDLPIFVNTVIAWFQQLPGRIQAAAINAWNAFTFWISKLWNDAKAFTINGINSIVSFISSLPRRIGAVAGSLWGAAVGGFNNFKNSAIAWAQNTIQSIVNFFAGLPGRIANAIRAGAGAVSSAFSSIKNTLAAGFSAGIGGRAVGGSVGANRPYFVGEKGVELFVPDTAGTIVPNSELSPNISSQVSSPDVSQGSAGNTYNIKISGAFARSGTELADLFEDGVNELNKRLGGAGKPKVLMG